METDIYTLKQLSDLQQSYATNRRHLIECYTQGGRMFEIDVLKQERRAILNETARRAQNLRVDLQVAESYITG